MTTHSGNPSCPDAWTNPEHWSYQGRSPCWCPSCSGFLAVLLAKAPYPLPPACLPGRHPNLIPHWIRITTRSTSITQARRRARLRHQC